MHRLAAYIGIEGGFDGLMNWILELRKASEDLYETWTHTVLSCSPIGSAFAAVFQPAGIPHTVVELLKGKVDATKWKAGEPDFEKIVAMALLDPSAGRFREVMRIGFVLVVACLMDLHSAGGNPIVMTADNTRFLLQCSLEGKLAPAP